MGPGAFRASLQLVMEVCEMVASLWNLDRSLLGDLDRLRQEIDSLFDQPDWGGIRFNPRAAYPLINTGETEDAIHVYVFAPGIDADSLEVNLQRNLLSIRGERKTDDAAAKTGTVHRSERFRGEFNRMITLPDTVDPDAVEASLHNGVLSINVGKRAEVQPRRIAVKSE